MAPKLTAEQLEEMIERRATEAARRAVEESRAQDPPTPSGGDGDGAEGEDGVVRRSELEEFHTRLEEVQRAQAELRRGVIPGSAEERHHGETFSMQKVATSLLARSSGNSNYRDLAPMEWEMHDAVIEDAGDAGIVYRAQATSPDSLGGFVVPGEVRDEFFQEQLRPKIVLFDLGMSELTASTTPVDIPVEGTVPTVDAVSENQANTAADVTFDQLRAEPHTAQSFIKASNRFLSMGTQGESYLRNIMARELAITFNSWGLVGSGANGQPIGVYNRAGNTVTFAGDGCDNAIYDDLLRMEEEVALDNALEGTLGWALPVKAVRAIRKIKSENAAASTESINVDRNAMAMMTEGASPTVLGYPYRRTTQLASSADAEVIFGDWSRLVMVSWGSLVIEASRHNDTAFEQRQTHIIAYQDVDFVVTQPNAFAIASGWDLDTTF